MQSHANNLARIESDWTLRDGVNSLISNISCTKQFELTWKWRHDDTETSFDFTNVEFYLFLYNETFTYKE